MSLLAPSGSHAQHEPLAMASLPPSPTEEDLGGASLWRDSEDGDDQSRERSAPDTAKRKGKAREVVSDEAESEGALTPSMEMEYPPTTEEEDESRKIEENLRRWEEADRQRRKTARDSAASTAPSSVVDDVSRRASSLWPGRLGGRNAPNGAHIHTALRQMESEDALPLGDLSSRPASPGVSKSTSPASSSHTSSQLGSPISSVAHPLSTFSAVENPFEPPDSATPLHNFSTDTAMRSSSPPLSTSATVNEAEDSPFKDPVTEDDRPVLQASGSLSPPRHSLRPPPRPLDLPPPKTPPPRMMTPGMAISTPPNFTHPPSQTRSAIDTTSPEPEHRWWTDWLCGCQEGGKGDEQAGRTNPFE
ncbi:hypothetical protein M0805_006374 [Coniferiporia weirii]|nr:hypothetical protein M0805_006374 [Coniferiporia weirii]